MLDKKQYIHPKQWPKITFSKKPHFLRSKILRSNVARATNATTPRCYAVGRYSVSRPLLFAPSFRYATETICSHYRYIDRQLSFFEDKRVRLVGKYSLFFFLLEFSGMAVFS